MPKSNDPLNESVYLHQQFAELINSSSSLSVFIEKISDLMLSDTSISNVALALYDTQADTISVPYSKEPRDNANSLAVHKINSPLRSVIDQKVPLIVKAPDYLSHCNSMTPEEPIPVMWAGLPILKDQELIGVLEIIANDGIIAEELKQRFSSLISFSEILAPYLSAKTHIEALKESENKFRQLVEASTDITFQISRDGTIDFVSSNIQTLAGYDPNLLIGKHLNVTTPEDQNATVIAVMKIIGAGKSVQNMMVTQKAKSGAYIPMEVSASPIYHDGEIIGAQGTLRDISERNQAHQEIERLAFFPLVNPMPVVEVNHNGVARYINPAGIQLLDRLNLDMSQVAQILPENFVQDIDTALSEKNQIPYREVSFEDLHLLWSAFSLQNQNLFHYYATDITTLKKTEKELIEAKEVAIKNEQVKTLFLANMSHEIRTPLNSILGFTELIEKEIKSKSNADLEAYFEIIHASGKRLWQTVHDILDISQIETGTFELKIETIDLVKIINDLGASFHSKAVANNIDLLINVPKHELRIAGDAYCATQALSNIIDNAIKYTSKGSVTIDTEISDSRIKVFIKDTGIGMSKEYQKQVFNAFSQESTGFTKHFQGVGLGLALTHRYLKLICGNIKLESEQDVGSTFTISFPINPEVPVFGIKPTTKAHSSNEETSAFPRISRMNILVVEDDPNSKKLAIFTLRKDFELFFADSVAESKEQLEKNNIELILLDLSLKGDEDGLDLVRYLRSKEKWISIPIIALTAHAFTSDRDRCLEAGCNDYITKPFRRLNLLETINKLI